MRLVGFTGFGQMHFVSGPARAVFLAVAGFLIVRRIDEAACRRNIRGLAPVQLTVVTAIVLHPDLTQDFDRRYFTRDRPARLDQTHRRAISSHLAQCFLLLPDDRPGFGEDASLPCDAHTDAARPPHCAPGASHQQR